MDNAFQNYSLLKEEVKQWQTERGTFWTEKLSPAQSPPYYPVRELPEKAILELSQRLNQVSNSVVPDPELFEAWERFKTFKPVTNPELLCHLQFALCGVAQLFRETMVEGESNSGNSPVKDYVGSAATRTMACPICGELAGISVLSPPNGKRFSYCTVCGHQWSAKRVGCIRCGTEEAAKLSYLKSEEYPAVEMVICQACGQYAKEFDLRVMNVGDVKWETIRTLPLDYAAENWLAEHAQSSVQIQKFRF